MTSKSVKNAYKSKGLFAAMLGRSLKDTLRFGYMYSKNQGFFISGVKNSPLSQISPVGPLFGGEMYL